MILDKDENMENTKSEREAKGEDLKYRKPNQQCQKHQNITAAAIKTKHRKKENHGDTTSMEEEKKNNKNINKTSKLQTRHFKLHQEN